MFFDVINDHNSLNDNVSLTTEIHYFPFDFHEFFYSLRTQRERNKKKKINSY